METLKTEIVIVGSGLTGLCTAFNLNEKKKSFIVLEKNNEVGGVIKTHEKDGFIYESGPNSGMVGNVEVVKLLDKLDGHVEIEKANSTVKKRYILKNKKWEPLPSGLISAISTPLFTLKDKFRLLGEPFRKKGVNPNETLSELVKRRMGYSFLNYAIDPFILGVYAGDPNKLVPKYALPKLYYLEQDYGSFIGGAYKKSKEKKTDLEKRVTKDIFMIKGGLSKLTNTLYKLSGKKNYKLGSEIISLKKVDDEFEIIFKKNEAKYKIISNKVITTFGGNNLAHILKDININNNIAVNNTDYAAVVQVALGFKKWKGMKLDAFGGLIPFSEKRNILGAIFISALNNLRAPKGGALFSVFLGGVRRPDIINKSNDEIKNIVKDEFMSLMAMEDFEPELFEIFRHRNAIPQYYANTKERLKAFNNLENKNLGLIIGGNTNDGIGMADRIKQAVLLSERAFES
jgi:oxygen-dependent protoporphyrinogen oxidase